MVALLYSWPVDLVLILVGLFFLLHKYISRNYGYWKAKNVPELEPKPFFGNIGDVMKGKTTMTELFRDIYNKVKTPVVGIYMIDNPILLIKDLDIIKSILIKDFNYFTDRAADISEKADFLSAHVLFISKGEEWKNTRTKITPVFTSGKLKQMTYLINEVGVKLMEYLEKNHHKSSLDAKSIGGDFFTDVISSCAFGINANSIEDNNCEFRRHGRILFDFSIQTAIRQMTTFFAPKLGALLRISFIPKETSNFFRNVFKTTIEVRKQNGTKRNDLIDIIMQILNNTDAKNYKFTEDVMLAQALQFFTAGFETSSTTMSFLLYELCQNQSLQAEVRKEILEVLEEHKEMSYDAIMSMKLLDNCISETVRMYPVLPFLDRKCLQDYKIPELNMTIEKGTWVYVPLYGIQMDEKYYPEPEKFKPERYSDENAKNIPQMSNLGFGAGPRNCIGERFGKLAVKMCVAYILSKYKVIPSEKTQSKIVFEKKSVLLQAEGGLPMKFVKIA